jgi:hypothetical protein
MFALVLWGLLSLLVMCAEPSKDTPILTLVCVEFGGLVSFLACLLTGWYLDKHGKLPKLED